MDEISSQRLEIFNEATIFIVGVLLAPYSASQFSPEQSEASNKVGWTLVGLTLGNVLVNELLMVWQVLTKLYELAKQLYLMVTSKAKKHADHSFDHSKTFAEESRIEVLRQEPPEVRERVCLESVFENSQSAAECSQSVFENSQSIAKCSQSVFENS